MTEHPLNRDLCVADAYKYWPEEGACEVIHGESHRGLVRIPLSFMREGHVNNYDYVFRQLQMSFSAVFPGHVVLNPQGEACQASHAVQAGVHILQRSHGGEFNKTTRLRHAEGLLTLA